MKAIVGLGNPGLKYRDTRHNVGFVVLDELADRLQASKPRSKFDADIAEAMLGIGPVLLVAPQTFMNASGRSVQRLVDFYQLDLKDLIVVCDDFNLDLGRLRLRASGTSGGHNGLEDVIQRLGRNGFPRLRIGVGRPPAAMDTADYVLGKFRSSERDAVQDAVVRSADAVETWVTLGIEAAMNQFNAASKPGSAADSDD